MFDVAILTQLINPTILIACLVVGYVIKNWMSTADNQIIPTVVLILGIVLSVVIAITNGTAITVETVVMGAISGLASTGLHQVFKTWLDSFGGNI